MPLTGDAEVKRLVGQHERDLRGVGSKPGLMARMLIMEEGMDEVRSGIRWIVRLCIAILIGLIVKIIYK